MNTLYALIGIQCIHNKVEIPGFYSHKQHTIKLN